MDISACMHLDNIICLCSFLVVAFLDDIFSQRNRLLLVPGVICQAYGGFNPMMTSVKPGLNIMKEL
jgi:hypothetical protein